MALLGRMAAGLAHEVRNPVTAIRLHAQLLEGAGPEDAAESRALIESEAERIEMLVGQWLRFARPAPPVMVELDLREVVGRGVARQAAQAAYAGVTLSVEAAGAGRCGSMGDGERLSQVLANLLLNAIQAMPQGGVAKVSVAGGGRAGRRCRSRIRAADSASGRCARRARRFSPRRKAGWAWEWRSRMKSAAPTAAGCAGRTGAGAGRRW